MALRSAGNVCVGHGRDTSESIAGRLHAHIRLFMLFEVTALVGDASVRQLFCLVAPMCAAQEGQAILRDVHACPSQEVGFGR